MGRQDFEREVNHRTAHRAKAVGLCMMFKMAAYSICSGLVMRVLVQGSALNREQFGMQRVSDFFVPSVWTCVCVCDV